MRLWELNRNCPNLAKHLALLALSLLASASSTTLAAPTAAPASIRVVMDNDYPPYVFRGPDGRLQGILPDLWQLWQQRTGIKVQLDAMDWDKALATMRNGRADVIDTIFETEERRESYDFSPPYATIKVAIFFDRHIGGITNAASLKGFRVGVKDGDACIDYLQSHGITDLKHYASYQAEVQAAIHRQIRLLCMDMPPAFYLLTRGGAADEFRYSPPLYTGQFHWAVAKGKEDLKQIIESGFARISDQQRKEIETRWLGHRLGEEPWPPVVRYGAYLLIAAALGGIALLAWNWSLRRRVDLRTRELSATLQSLRRSEGWRNAMLDTAMDGFWLVDGDARLLEVNETYCRMSGYSERELLQMRVTDVEVVETDADTDTRMRRVKAHGEDRFESRHRRKDGRIFDVEVSIQYRTEVGEHFVAFLRDITERKQAEQDKFARENQLRAFYELDLVGLAITSPEKGWIRVNEHLCRMLEYSESELRSMTWTQLTYPDDLPADVAQFQRLLENEIQGYSLEKRFVSRSGRIVPTRLVVRCAHKPDGTIDYAIAMVEDLSEQKRAESALRSSEDKFRKAFYLSPDSVNINRLEDGLFVSINRGFTKLMGYTEDEILGRTSREFDIWADLADRAFLVDEIKKKGFISNLEARFRAKDGSIHHGLMSAALIDIDGTAHLINITRDITERKHMEESLVHAQTRLLKAQRVARMGFLEWNLKTNELICSEEVYAMYGLPANARESTPEFVSRLVHPDDRAFVQSNLDRAVRGIKPYDIDHRIRRPDGTVIWVHAQAELVASPNGDAGVLLGTVVDITERKHAELRILLEHTVATYITTATEETATIEYVIRAFCETEGWERGTYWQSDDASGAMQMCAYWNRPGAGLERFINKSRALTFKPGVGLVGLVWQSKEALWIENGILDTRMVHKDLLRESGLRCVFTFPIVAATKVIGVCSLFGRDPREPDATLLAAATVVGNQLGQFLQRKRMESLHASLEAQLRESQKMQAIGTLAGGIAHDFNNIIATILGNADLAREDLGPDAAALRSVEQIRKAAERARGLVAQILSFSRKQVVERRPIALQTVIEDVARLLRATLPARISLDVDCAADVPTTLADANQIEQVLLNLATNAMQAIANSHGHIHFRLDAILLDPESVRAHPALETLRAKYPDRTVRLTVCDDGPGIDTATRERIFEPFFTTKPVGIGTGLGLSVVHGIVQVHEGAITVESEPGEGARFTIYLPSVAGQAAAVKSRSAPTDAAEQPVVGARQHILYVDDDESLALLVRRLLERRGFRISAYTDPREALDAFDARPGDFDLVVVDHNMPGMLGLDVARTILATRSNIPVAIVSGFIDDALRADAPAAGVHELVFKAETSEDLCEAIARIAQGTARAEPSPGLSSTAAAVDVPSPARGSS